MPGKKVKKDILSVENDERREHTSRSWSQRGSGDGLLIGQNWFGQYLDWVRIGV